MRRARAEANARMRYETFRRNNDAFKKSWYYGIVKYTTYSLIVLGYALALTMFLAPVLAWFITKEGSAVFFMLFIFLFSPHTFKYARELHKGSRPYFTNYG